MVENTNPQQQEEHPLTPQKQEELEKALQEKGGKVSLMVAGKTGTGKSTLINGLLDLTDPNNAVGLVL